MKRVYKSVAIEARHDGHVVLLDGRELKSPAKAPLIMPTAGLARAVADEWDAQGDEIVPATMVNMQLAATAVDRVSPHREAVITEISGYGGSDHLCYRAEEPEDLVELQARSWEPMLNWCRAALGVDLAVTSGIMPLPQDPAALTRIRDEVARHCDMELAALHTLTSGTGSIVLGLAVSHEEITAERAFEISQIDEQFQIDKWGEDEEAQIRRSNLHRDILTAGKFFKLCREK